MAQVAFITSADPFQTASERISVEGRQWVRKNYNPVATATRFIKAVLG